MKRIIISGGGTGGHIFPAIAIANELKAIEPNIEILFVGAENKMEMEKVPQAGYKIVGLPIAGINRSNILANVTFPIKLIKSLWKAYRIVKDFKPNAAVGVGGYASGPTLMMASLLGIPTLLQEQNSYAGITNKFLAKKAKRICVAYPNMDKFFPKEKIILTGNPVRKDIAAVFGQQSTAKQADALTQLGLNANKKTLLVIGGSQGAKTINEAIAAGLDDLNRENIQVIWQTGKLFIDKAKKLSDNNPDIKASDFIYDMALAYSAADMVVSRAGALSVSELAIAGKPTIFIPLPTAAEDHQTMNAMSLVNKNAAWIVKDNVAISSLTNKIIELANNSTIIKQLAHNIKSFAKPNAGQEIAREVLGL